MAANELPDIFFTWGGAFSQPFVDAGKILPLEDYYTQYEELVSRATLANITYDETIYGGGHEMYGEDPFLSGILGAAFIKGLQGEGKP